MSFKSIASEQLSNNLVSFPDLEGRTAIKPAEVMKKHPDGVTIVAFGWWKDGELVPVIVKEEPDRFIWAGKILTDIVEAWVCQYDYKAETCSEALAAEGGVKVKFREGKTKGGRPITFVDIVD